MNDDVIMRMPLSIGPMTAEELRDTLTTNIYMHNNDCLCDNPWTEIKGIETESETKIDWGALSEIINRAVREAIQEDSTFITPEIEKYRIKYR
jgi:hypothetical protein